MTDAQLDLRDPRWNDSQTALDDHDDDPREDGRDGELPAECPDCDTVMETRGQVMTHMLYALGDDDHRAGRDSEQSQTDT